MQQFTYIPKTDLQKLKIIFLPVETNSQRKTNEMYKCDEYHRKYVKKKQDPTEFKIHFIETMPRNKKYRLEVGYYD